MEIPAASVRAMFADSVDATDSVEIIRDQGTANEESLGACVLLSVLFLSLNRAFVGLPIAGDPVQNLMGAFTAGTEFVRTGHRRVLYAVYKGYII